MYHLYATKFHAIRLDVNGTDIVQPVEVAEDFAKISIYLSVYLLTCFSFFLPVGYLVYCPVIFVLLPIISELDILKA